MNDYNKIPDGAVEMESHCISPYCILCSKPIVGIGLWFTVDDGIYLYGLCEHHSQNQRSADEAEAILQKENTSDSDNDRIYGRYHSGYLYDTAYYYYSDVIRQDCRILQLSFSLMLLGVSPIVRRFAYEDTMFVSVADHFVFQVQCWKIRGDILPGPDPPVIYGTRYVCGSHSIYRNWLKSVVAYEAQYMYSPFTPSLLKHRPSETSTGDESEMTIAAEINCSGTLQLCPLCTITPGMWPRIPFYPEISSYYLFDGVLVEDMMVTRTPCIKLEDSNLAIVANSYFHFMVLPDNHQLLPIHEIISDALLTKCYTLVVGAEVDLKEWRVKIGFERPAIRHDATRIQLEFSPSDTQCDGYDTIAQRPYLMDFYVNYRTCQLMNVVGTYVGEKSEALFNVLVNIGVCILRDFWVSNMVEYRTRSERMDRVIGRKSNGKKIWRKGVRIVYLPRTDVVVAQPDTSRTYQKSTVAAHAVRGHVRRLASPEWKPSEMAIQNAINFGFNIPDGFTFVKPHERGEELRQSIYRSRSALQYFYSQEGGKRNEVH